MGLDTYLYAEKRFAGDGTEAKAVLDVVGVTLADLLRQSEADPYEEERALYIGGWRHSTDEEKARYDGVLAASGLAGLTTDDSPSVHVGYKDGELAVWSTCIYWRKANAIHSWFVENCQDGIDECEEAAVTAGQLGALRATCSNALTAYKTGHKDEAEKILTPQSGFFFGSTDVDEWWAEDVERTITEIDKVTAEADRVGGVSFACLSSW